MSIAKNYILDASTLNKKTQESWERPNYAKNYFAVKRQWQIFKVGCPKKSLLLACMKTRLFFLTLQIDMLMKKSIFFLLLLAASAWLASLPACNKSEERSTIIQGRIVEYGTGTPIEGARVYVLCQDGTGPSDSSLADSILTDADGNFYREYAKGELCSTVYLLPYKEGYFKGNELDLTTDNKFFDVMLDPESWLKIRCIADGDQSSLHFQVVNFSKDVLKWHSSDTTFQYLGGVPLLGNREKRISWRTYPNQIYYEDTIYLSAHDTTIYAIHY